MISFVRGPGGVFARLAAELVPFAVGLVAAGLVLPTLRLPWAIIALVVVWIGASALLRSVRRRPRLRLLYRIAVAAHVLFWSVLGVLATDRAPPGAIAETRASAWRTQGGFRAGYGSEVIVPPVHGTLAGWGTPPRRVTYPPFAGFGVLGRHGRTWMGAMGEDGARKPLFARPQVIAGWPEVRAVVLRPERPEGGAPVAIARIDLISSDADLAREIHAGVADLGFPPEGVLIAATHTHSSPGGFSRQPFSAVAGTDHFDPAVFAEIRDAAVRAIRAAHGNALPARISIAVARDRGADGKPILARSRRNEAPDRIDDRAYVVRIDENTSEARPIAVLVNYAIHPVLVRRRYMGWHRDLAGAIEHAFTERLPGRPPVLFLNGACGDIAPRDDRLAGDGREHALAGRFADAVLPALRAEEPGPALWVSAARVRRPMGDPHLVLASGDRAAWLDAHGGPIWSGGIGALASNLVALPANAFVWSLGIPEMRVGFRWDGSVGAVINLEKHVTEHALPFGALVVEAATTRFALLWTPGEGSQAYGKVLREQAKAQGFEHALVVSWVNGSAAYLTTDAEYRADTYEARGSLYGPKAGSLSLAALRAALETARGMSAD